jgi:hypothetical protein
MAVVVDQCLSLEWSAKEMRRAYWSVNMIYILHLVAIQKMLESDALVCYTYMNYYTHIHSINASHDTVSRAYTV